MESVKKTCIFCNKLKAEKAFNKEHVIPETIGGKYTVDSVCRECNEKLGKEIDTPLVRNKIMAIGRNEFRIRRGNRRIPSAFKGQYADGTGQKYTIEFNEKGEAYSVQMSEVNSTPNNINITVDAKNKNHGFELLDRELKKRGLENVDPNQIEFKESKGTKKILIDSVRNDALIFGALKIAFEFTHEVCPDYIESELSDIYRKILLEPKLNEEVQKLLLEEVNIKKWYSNRLKEMDGIKKYHHLVFLTPIKGKGLYCYVKLFNTALLVQMSDSEHLSSEVILLNDAKNGNRGFVLNAKLKSFHLQLFSYTGQSRPKDILTNNKGQVPVYDEQGNQLYEHLDQLLSPESVVPKRKDFASKKMKLTQHFSDVNYFLKTEKEEGLLKVESIEFYLELVI